MSTEKRKIDFYSFLFNEYLNNENNEYWNREDFDLILKYIELLPVENRLIKDQKSKKSYYLSDIEYSNNIRCLKFKSCKFGHCPPIMDSDTAFERPTDKKMHEGEQENTHLVIRLDEFEGVVILEARKSGVAIGKIVRYFNEMFERYFKENPKSSDPNYSINITYMIIPIKDFDKALSDMSKLKFADIYIHKDFIGSDLNSLVPEEDPYIKDDLILTIKSKRGENLMVRTVKEIYNKLSNTSNGISRVRIHGINTSGASQILDSNIIKRTEKIEAELSDNGLISSRSIFNKMIEILKD